MKNVQFKKIAKEFLFLLVQIIFSNIKLFEGFSSIGLSFAFARLFFGGNLLVVTGSFALSKLVLWGGITELFISAYEIVLLTLYYFSKEFIKTKRQLLLCVVFLCFSCLLNLYISLENWLNLVKFLVGFALCLFSFLFFVLFCRSYKNKFVLFRLSESDYLMFSLMILLVSVGIFSFGFVKDFLGYFVIVFVAMILCKILPADKFFVCLIVSAVGALVSTQNLEMLIFTALVSVIFIQFKDFNKYVFALACLISLGVLAFILQIFKLLPMISFAVAVFAFVCIPQKVFNFLSELFVFDGQNIIFKNIQEKKVEALKNKLFLMSDTFSKMQRDFKFLLVGKIDREKASNELCQDIITKCCLTCENYRTCYMENINKRRMFEGLMLKAIENKSITLADMSNGVQSYCSKSAIVANEVNQTAKMFLSYENAMKSEDASKLMIASELGNFADIFKNFAEGLSFSLKPNKHISKILKERLLGAMIDVKEVLLLEQSNGIEQVVLIAPNAQVLRRELAEVLFKVTKNKMKLKTVSHLSESGLAIASFVPESKIRIEWAVTTKAKEQKNGDNVVIEKLSENKFFVAVADGMGHGESAHKISSMVLSLIRSMFEVGLNDNLILDSVNKLLVPAGLDTFTTLDACVIDTEFGECTFIKLGSSVSIIKHKQTSEVITCKSLPIGIVQNIKPTIVKKHIVPGDMIFLASDGVVDSFSSVDDFKSFVNDAKIYNIQKFTDDVVFDGQGLVSKHIDDMTIIGINLLKK